MRKIFIIGYVIIGAIVASSNSYLSHLDGLKPILSAVLAIALWPLVLFGVGLHLK